MSRAYLVRRLLEAALTAIALLLLAFFLIHLAPGDPVVALTGEHGDPGTYALIRARFGLDRPLGMQLLAYVSRVAHGDLGVSFVHGRPVLEVIAERVPATLLLAGLALVVSSVAGVALGALAARAATRPGDVLVRAAVLVGAAAPPFWAAQIAVLALAVGLGLFPVQGMSDARAPAAGVAAAVDVLRHLVLPTLVLAAAEVGVVTRFVRAGLLAALEADYVRTARAKGLGEWSVVRHALRNVLLPVVSVIGGRVGMLVTGAVLVETVFAWPGLGRLLVSSIQTRDHSVILGLFLCVALSVTLASLVTDLVYAALDPRIRYD